MSAKQSGMCMCWDVCIVRGTHDPLYGAGARSLFYGSALGLGGVVLIGALALRIMDVRSPADLRERMQSAVQPLGATVRESMLPMKESMQVRYPTYAYQLQMSRVMHLLGLPCTRM